MDVQQIKSTYGATITFWANQQGYPSKVGSLDDYVNIVSGIIAKESSGNPNASGDNGCSLGLMQLNLCAGTPQQYGFLQGVEDLYDPTTNIHYGTLYLNDLLSQYTVQGAISAYNAGTPTSSNVASYVDVVLSYAKQLGTNLSQFVSNVASNPTAILLVLGIAIGGYFLYRHTKT